MNQLAIVKCFHSKKKKYVVIYKATTNHWPPRKEKTRMHYVM